MTDLFRAYTEHVNPGLGRFLEVSGRAWRFVRAEGCTLVTNEGERFDDWLSGFGALSLGHNPPSVREALRRALEGSTPNLYSEALNPYAGSLARKLALSANFQGGTAHFCSSGAEAVETMLKTAIAATGRDVIVYADGGYHGVTLGALGCMAPGLYRDSFERVLPRFESVAFGDGDAVELRCARGDVAGVLIEPVQVESGVRVASETYLRAIRESCDRHGALMLLDEVQTGLGRTGTLYAFERGGVTPDAFSLAKSLGGGMVAIGAMVAREGVWSRAFGSYLRAEVHASTMGGNALACVAAESVLQIVGDGDFLASVRAKGERLWSALRTRLAGRACVASIEGVGLLGGIRLREPESPLLSWEAMGMPELAAQPTSGPLLLERLARKRVLTQVCGHDWSTVRVEPPLIVDDAAIDRFVDAVDEGTRWLDEAW